MTLNRVQSALQQLGYLNTQFELRFNSSCGFTTWVQVNSTTTSHS
jgi:hypothetical protein